MTSDSKFKEAADALWKEQSEDRWMEFAKALEGSNAAYYKVVFANEGKLSRMQDLTKSYAEIYDKEYRPITKVPIVKKEGKKVRGATIYLMGLRVSNKASE
jgi:hypothetical protein